jgi:hypothetical protein
MITGRERAFAVPNDDPCVMDQLWSLHGSKNSSDYTVVAVFAMAQRSDTTFGTCRLIIQ